MRNDYEEVYLDSAASTLPSPAVIQTMNDVVKEYANPSSAHEMGIRAREIIDSATDTIANIIHCKPEEIHYTSGATMSNSLAIQGWLRANPGGVIITSMIEHNDIVEMCKYLESKGRRVVYLAVDRYGYVRREALEETLQRYSELKIPVLVSIQFANSEVGVIQDIYTLSELTHYYGGTFHTDATQYIPNFLIDCDYDKYVDMFSMSGQKINCIKGTGILYVRSGVKIDPIIFGEQGLIGGTENTIGIACLGKAFEELNDKITPENSIYLIKLLSKRNQLIKGLSDLGTIVCEDSICLPNNVAVIIKGITGERLVELLSERGFYISSGSACSSYVMKPSHVLTALRYNEEEASSCIRITINENVTQEQINEFLKTLHLLVSLLNKE